MHNIRPPIKRGPTVLVRGTIMRSKIQIWRLITLEIMDQEPARIVEKSLMLNHRILVQSSKVTTGIMTWARASLFQPHKILTLVPHLIRRLSSAATLASSGWQASLSLAAVSTWSTTWLMVVNRASSKDTMKGKSIASQSIFFLIFSEWNELNFCIFFIIGTGGSTQSQSSSCFWE